MKLQHGIYYAYWEKEWSGDYLYYIEKAAELGFDILEIAAGPLAEYTSGYMKKIKNKAKMCGIRITAGHGPLKTQDISSGDKNIRVKALEFYKKLFNNMAEMDINLIGGALYSY